jgi:hypothetical protein
MQAKRATVRNFSFIRKPYWKLTDVVQSLLNYFTFAHLFESLH